MFPPDLTTGELDMLRAVLLATRRRRLAEGEPVEYDGIGPVRGDVQTGPWARITSELWEEARELEKVRPGLTSDQAYALAFVAHALVVEGPFPR